MPRADALKVSANATPLKVTAKAISTAEGAMTSIIEVGLKLVKRLVEGDVALSWSFLITQINNL